YNGANPQNAPIASPDDKAPTTATGASVRSSAKRICRTSWITGWAKRVHATGTRLSVTRMLATANNRNEVGSSRRNICCASASAIRLTTMYTANTWPRCAAGVCPFNQLSITVYSITSAAPVITRNNIQNQGSTNTTCSSTELAATAAQIANARIWPTRVITVSARCVPTK